MTADWLRKLADDATPGPWAWMQRFWPNTRVTTLRSGSATYEDMPGVPRSVLNRIDYISDADARLIALAPDLARKVWEAVELLALDAEDYCGDPDCNSFSCRAYAWLQDLEALQPKETA